MEFNLNTIMMILFGGIFLAACGRTIYKSIRTRYATVKTVDAQVVDKFKSASNIRRYGTFTREQYTVVFTTKEKKLSFTVSQFSYNGYRLREKGKLTYQGSRLIKFE